MSKKVKILTIYPSYDYEEETYNQITSGITEWEEVSESILEDLQRWTQKRNRDGRKNETILVVAQDDREMINECIADYRKLQEKEEAQEAKRRETARKRKETMKRKKEEKERAKLAELQEKYGKAS
jgi:basic membrane lipoprotein Med (substrate-binding protein (PBP1-ABC) superfamily)